MIQLLLLLLAAASPLRPILPTDSPPTITASRDHPGAADSCPLDLPEDFFRGVSAACTDAAASFSDLCCPALAAWLYTAYSTAALETRVQPSSTRSYDELPVLPGDSEPCAAAAEAALRARGIKIPGSNDTCGAASCACGVGLHPLQCEGPFVVAGGGEGRWVPKDGVAGRLEVGCSQPAAAGCTRCLTALYQMTTILTLAQHMQCWARHVPSIGVATMYIISESGTSRQIALPVASKLRSKEKGKGGGIDGEDSKGGRECQLMGLTWLLSTNRTRYLPTAAYVIRAFRAADAGGRYPATCSVAGDIPLPVGYEQLLGTGSFIAARGSSTAAASAVFRFLPVMCFFLI
ncbi:hypothetical protein KSP39_PZI015630 [Platanthera zijinensis]|uniref:SPARK domain-containing protein n=1 Tax=Platanthera zijinensis TaxID=2320716 RepID=A0AAP0B825_9ASPA